VNIDLINPAFAKAALSFTVNVLGNATGPNAPGLRGGALGPLREAAYAFWPKTTVDEISDREWRRSAREVLSWLRVISDIKKGLRPAVRRRLSEFQISRRLRKGRVPRGVVQEPYVRDGGAWYRADSTRSVEAAARTVWYTQIEVDESLGQLVLRLASDHRRRPVLCLDRASPIAIAALAVALLLDKYAGYEGTNKDKTWYSYRSRFGVCAYKRCDRYYWLPGRGPRLPRFCCPEHQNRGE